MGRGIGRDRGGIEEIPMKLLVIMVAVGFIVPAAYHGMSVNAQNQTKTDLQDAMDELVTAIRFVYGQGTLETREVTLDLGNSRFSDLGPIIIGDRIGEHPGVNQSTISYKYGSAWEHVVVTDPNIPITSPDNSALILDGYDKWELVIQKDTIGFTDFVVVRVKGQEGEVQMPDLYVGSISVLNNPIEGGYEVDDDTWQEYKPEMLTPFVPPGYSLSAVIKNIGNLGTDDPDAKWNDGIGEDDGVIRVRFIDYIIDKNETRQIGEPVIITNLAPDEEITITADQPWRVVDYLYRDWAFDRELLNRKIIAQVDYIEYDIDVENQTSNIIGGDNIDEIDGENNNREYLHIEIPPVINSVEAEYDDPDPGIGVFVQGIEVFNKFTINATDENGFVWQILMWYNGDELSIEVPADCDIPTQVLMEEARRGNFFTTYIDMGGINGTSNLTIAAIDNAGVGSDPYETSIYIELPPRWMENTDDPTRATTSRETGTQSRTFTPSTSGNATGGNGPVKAQLNYFTLILELPQTLNDGKKADASGDTPYVSGQENKQSEKYVLELKIPIGGEISFGKEKTLESTVMGMEVTGTAGVEASVNVGFPDIEINLTKIFDLIKEGKYLITNWKQFGPLLKDVKVNEGTVLETTVGELWKKVLKPDNVADLMNALNQTRNAAENESANTSSDYSGITDAISNIVEIVEEYQATFETLKEVWGTVMNIADNPASLLDLVSFEARVYASLEVMREWQIFSAKYPIFPPFVMASVDVSAAFSAVADTEAKISATLSGVKFGQVTATFTLGLGLYLVCEFNIGVNFGIAGGGMFGRIIGNPNLALTTGFTYDTPTIGIDGTTAGGFIPVCNGALDVSLMAEIGAYVEFLWWRKDWTFYKDVFQLGHWSFDVFEGTTEIPPIYVPPEQDLDAMAEKDGTINFPRGPASATFDGKTIVVTSKDLNNDFLNPNYQIQAKADGPAMTPSDILTTNNRLKVDPKVIYNHTGSAFVVWTEAVTNQDLTSTTIGLTNFMNDADILYAIIDESNVVISGPDPIYSKPAGTSDMQTSMVLANDDNITLTWISDTDGDMMSTGDQRTMFSIWNGTNWSAPVVKFWHASFHYDNKMVNLPNGDIMSTWIRDGDEYFNTTHDQQIVYSIYNGTNWTDYKYITNDNLSVKSTSLAINGDNIILVWHAQDWEFDSYIRYCTWNTVTETWSTIELVNYTTRPVQLPQVVVNQDGLAAVVWKNNKIIDIDNVTYSGIYYCTIDLMSDRLWTKPRLVATTNAHFLDFNCDTELIERNTIIYTYNNLTTPYDRSTEEQVSINIYFRPDMGVSALSVNGNHSNIIAKEDEIVQLEATIQNTGDLFTQAFNVSFYDGEPEAGGTLIESVPVSSIGRFDMVNVSIDWEVPGGIHNVFVIADHENKISEIVKNNNRLNCTITCPIDLSITFDNIDLDPEYPNQGETVTITAMVRNVGYTSASFVKVEFYDGDPTVDGKLFDTETISYLDMDENATVTAYWVADLGAHELFVFLNISDLIPDNNLAFRRVSLVTDISIKDISVNRALINEGEKATVSVTLQNDGKADSDSVFVKFYTYDDFIDGKFISLDHGETGSVYIEWQAPVGNFQIYAVAFPTDNIMEIEESENKRSVHLAVLTSKDLTIGMILAEHDNGILNITTNVSNIGHGDLTGVEVDLYGSYDAGNDTLLHSFNITKMDESSQYLLYYEWAAPVGTKTVYATVDPMDRISEMDENNNQASERLDFGTWASDDGQDTDDDGTIDAVYAVSMIGILLLVLVVLAMSFIKKRRGDREEE